jgi:uncharacterized membrane protein
MSLILTDGVFFVDYFVYYSLTQIMDKSIYTDIIKTITYRILGTSVTFGIGFISTGSLKVASAMGVSELTIKPILYFIHERLWKNPKVWKIRKIWKHWRT